MFPNTDGGSIGLDFPLFFKTGKSGGKCLRQTTLFGLSGILSLGMAFTIFVVLLNLMVVGTRLLFPFLRDNWIYSQLHNTF